MVHRGEHVNWNEYFMPRWSKIGYVLMYLLNVRWFRKNIDLTFNLRKILAHKQEVIVMHIFKEALLCIFELIRSLCGGDWELIMKAYIVVLQYVSTSWMVLDDFLRLFFSFLVLLVWWSWNGGVLHMEAKKTPLGWIPDF